MSLVTVLVSVEPSKLTTAKGTANRSFAAIVKKLEKGGLQVTDVKPDFKLVIGDVEESMIEELNMLDGVKQVRKERVLRVPAPIPKLAQ